MEAWGVYTDSSVYKNVPLSSRFESRPEKQQTKDCHILKIKLFEVYKKFTILTDFLDSQQLRLIRL